MLTTPTMNSVFFIDGLVQNFINFKVIGGDRQEGFEYIITNPQNEIVSQNTLKTISTKILIPKNTLENNLEYKIKVRTFVHITPNNSVETLYSDWSKTSLIETYKSATVTIDNIKTVDKQSYTFNGVYSQSAGIKIKNYRYILYDEDGYLIKEYKTVYTLDSTNLTQFMSGFVDGNNYKIELICTDQNNVVTKSPLYDFECKIDIPKIKQVLKLKQDKCNAQMCVEANVKQLRFISGNDDWEYYNHEYIDLTKDGWIYMDSSFEIAQDFDLQIWFGKLIKDKEIITLNELSSGDYLKVWYDSNDKLFKCTKKYNNYIMQYRSIETYEVDNGWYSVLVKQLNGRIGLFIERYADMQPDNYFFITEGVGHNER